ncbi:hypothetical protein HCN44_002396 [Aphidius gifuensis]|uniref:beta-N-acetylhexosaminidase n=1 Tax=Aphidius gifuensis TaxID=684658 RepID=A0A834XZX1_APHGI|nr:chitooligosaccharidolytic beta-N-acetylglucosaminidase-like [Aphidius gifuensis]KAF7996750.1 hypothetical protein HCN44_002396 [Aphidius gifuensis]
MNRIRARSTGNIIFACIGIAGIIIIFRLLSVQVDADHSESSELLEYNSPWHYECINGFCSKTEKTLSTKNPVSLDVCQLFCGDGGTLWPKPTGLVSLGEYVAHIDPDKIILHGIDGGSSAGKLIEKNIDILKQHIKKIGNNPIKIGGLGLTISIVGLIDPDNVKITLETKESYSLKITRENKKMISVAIEAESYFGIRNGFSTLSQLIVFDEFYNKIQIVRDVTIIDSPVYPYRGILLDTSRNYIDKATILRTIEGMGMSKLNTFHWHITDSHSFPYVSKTLPKMSKYGAYSPQKIYTPDDVKEIVEYGLVHGVRILPELDAPAHVGEGWQWVGDDATVCFKAEPWNKYCVEPPCGQLNPASEKVYEILEGIYGDMIEDFKPDIFHMGGDEVNMTCWNSSLVITDWMKKIQGWNLKMDSFIDLWALFQERAYEKLKKANGGKDLHVVLWTSGLTTDKNLMKLDPKRYIIQVWTSGDDMTIGRLAEGNYKMIISNYDALYLDCGLSAWVGEGTNWCSPYKGWQKIYKNSPLELLKRQGYESKKHLILGGEAALWSEQVDSTSVDSRLWPRAAAMAERLWGEPETSWSQAEQRMLRHRERLVSRGILADSLEPEWCLQNQGHCYAQE